MEISPNFLTESFSKLSGNSSQVERNLLSTFSHESQRQVIKARSLRNVKKFSYSQVHSSFYDLALQFKNFIFLRIGLWTEPNFAAKAFFRSKSAWKRKKRCRKYFWWVISEGPRCLYNDIHSSLWSIKSIVSTKVVGRLKENNHGLLEQSTLALKVSTLIVRKCCQAI